MTATTWKTRVSSLLVVILLLQLLGGGLLFVPKAEAMRNLLFPLITTETGKFTFIAIVNDGSGFPPIAGYRFTYMSKAATAAQTAGCEHFDANVLTTPVDKLIFEAGGKVQTDPPSFVLFEGAAPVTSTAAVLSTPGQIGFMIVGPSVDSDAFLFGWASVVDAASGLAWTYSTDFLTSNFAGDPDFLRGDFSRIDGSLAFADRKWTSWSPASIVTTTWYILPLGAGVAMAPPGGGGLGRGITSADDHVNPGVAGAYDLDEQFFSGGKTKSVRCWAFAARSDLFPPAVVAATAGGGHASIIPAAVPPDFVVGPYLLYKFMSTTALGGTHTTINREPAHTPSFCNTPNAACVSP